MTAEIKPENKELQQMEDKELKLQDIEIKDNLSENEKDKLQHRENTVKLQNLAVKDDAISEQQGKDVMTKEEIEKNKEKYIIFLKRFLHYTSEYLVYKPGDRFYLKSFSKSNLESLSKLAELESPKNIVDLIVKVKKDGTSVQPESIVFALALCTRMKDKPDLQSEAYKALHNICSDPKDFFLFMKFSRELNLPHMLGGKGWKRAVTKWYNLWTPFDFMQILTRHRSHYGWTHKDVLRLAHIKSNNPQQKMLISYALNGYNATKTAFENSDDEFVKEILNYLTQWKNFLMENDMAVATKKIEEGLYPLEVIPHNMLKYQDVWNAILPRLEIKELVRVLQRLSILGFLRNNCLTVQIFTDSLDNYYSKQNSDIHPAEVFIALRSYENGARIRLELATKLKHPISLQSPPKAPPKLNPLIINALTNLYSDLFTMLPPTTKTYLIGIDCRAKFSQFKCMHSLYLSAREAAHVITKTISSAESEGNVTTVGFGEKGIVFIIPIKKDLKLKDYGSVIKESDGGSPPDISKAIHYARQQKLDVDIFVMLTDHTATIANAQHALNSYRSEMNKDSTKLVMCSLTGKLKTHKDIDGKGILCIYGFDKKVCRVIDAFARGAF